MWFGFIAPIKPCLKMSTQQTMSLEGNHIPRISANLLTVYPFCRTGALSVQAVLLCPLKLFRTNCGQCEDTLTLVVGCSE